MYLVTIEDDLTTSGEGVSVKRLFTSYKRAVGAILSAYPDTVVTLTSGIVEYLTDLVKHKDGGLMFHFHAHSGANVAIHLEYLTPNRPIISNKIARDRRFHQLKQSSNLLMVTTEDEGSKGVGKY